MTSHNPEGMKPKQEYWVEVIPSDLEVVKLDILSLKKSAAELDLEVVAAAALHQAAWCSILNKSLLSRMPLDPINGMPHGVSTFLPVVAVNLVPNTEGRCSSG
jgi:hypothetical protein